MKDCPCGYLLVGCFLLTSLVRIGNGFMCDRTTGITVPKTPGNGKFQVSISGDPEKYVPGAIYTVKIQGQGQENSDRYGTEKFTGFLLVAESEFGNSGQVSAGAFRLKGDSLVRFSEFCPNAVKHASEVAKAEVEVLWVAPQASTGCVNFRATVIKTPQIWYMDDGNLTRPICPEEDEVQVHEGDYNETCTACDEAKYELTFEALWSSLTHPKGFPNNVWQAHFSDIIGASHSSSVLVWDYNKIASRGLEQVAEQGDPSILEAELKEKSENIRTIIKARGIPHTQQSKGLKTFAIFRADRNHNLVSFVSKIDPSPDWFVGVSRLNLCGKNGSWVTEKTMNLFPIDAGTDSGSTYSSPDMPTNPHAEIRRLVWSSDEESPFFDPDGNMLKPFARVKIQQQRSYKRGGCDEAFNGESIGSSNDYGDDVFSDDSPDRDRPECSVHAWGAFGRCIPPCGKGIKRRYRNFVNETVARAFGCKRNTTDERVCSTTCNSPPGQTYGGAYVENYAPIPTSPAFQFNSYGMDTRSRYQPETRKPSFAGAINRNSFDDANACRTSEWKPWSICTDPCGISVRYRTRTKEFLQPSLAQKHNCNPEVLRQMEPCPKTSECKELKDKVDAHCELSEWGPWLPCTQTCGKGVKTRSKIFLYPTMDHSDCKEERHQTLPCDGILPQCPVERDKEDCLEEKRIGKCSSSHARWYFDKVKLKCVLFQYSGCDGNRNNFNSRQDCQQTCGSLQDTGRTRHSNHQLNSYTSSRRHGSNNPRNSFTSSMNSGPYSQNPMNNYNTYSSPQNNPPASNFRTYQMHHNRSYNDEPPIDCRLSPWSNWSKCNVKCGRGWKYQYRYVEVFNENGGQPCSTHLERSERCRGKDCGLPNKRYNSQRNYQYSEFDDYEYLD